MEVGATAPPIAYPLSQKRFRDSFVSLTVKGFRNTMTNEIQPIIMLLMFCLFLCITTFFYWRSNFVPQRMLRLVKNVAGKTQTKICGQPVEHWISILKQNTKVFYYVFNTVVINYQGHSFIFIDAAIPSTIRRGFTRKCFLVAVGSPAIKVLSDQEHLFHLFASTTELAAFSIFRHSDFINALSKER